MFVGICLFIATSLVSISETVGCLKPELAERQYTISTETASYLPGYKFKVICQPGYKDEGMRLIVCQTDGTWLGLLPTCDDYYPGLSVPWYGVLIIISSLVIFISCVTPRVWMWLSSTKKKRVKIAPVEKVKLQDYPRKNSEIPKRELPQLLPWFKKNRVGHGLATDLPPVLTPFAVKHHRRARHNLKF